MMAFEKWEKIIFCFCIKKTLLFKKKILQNIFICKKMNSRYHSWLLWCADIVVRLPFAFLKFAEKAETTSKEKLKPPRMNLHGEKFYFSMQEKMDGMQLKNSTINSIHFSTKPVKKLIKGSEVQSKNALTLPSYIDTTCQNLTSVRFHRTTGIIFTGTLPHD